MDKMWKSFFAGIMYTLHHNTTNFLYASHFSHILHLDIIKSKINFKLKVKINNPYIYGFQCNPYTHSIPYCVIHVYSPHQLTD